MVAIPGHGDVAVDISYGGAYYAFINAEKFGLDVRTSKIRDLVDVATAVTNAVKMLVEEHSFFRHWAHSNRLFSLSFSLPLTQKSGQKQGPPSFFFLNNFHQIFLQILVANSTYFYYCTI